MNVEDPSYYVSRTSLVISRENGMRRWRKRLFVALTKLASDPVEYFGLPDDRVVIMGSRVAL
jgi:KUP system potassium uptake protein